MNIETVEDFAKAIDAGPYAWPGGYPMYFLTSDGGVLSFDAAKAERELIEQSITDNSRDGWRVVAVEVNWEDDSLTCDHTGQPIESAYGTPVE